METRLMFVGHLLSRGIYAPGALKSPRAIHSILPHPCNQAKTRLEAELILPPCFTGEQLSGARATLSPIASNGEGIHTAEAMVVTRAACSGEEPDPTQMPEPHLLFEI